MKKILILSCIIMILSISIVLAEEKVYNNLPEGKTIEQFKKDVSEANGYSPLATSTTSNGYWGLCGQFCADFKNKGDCKPCRTGEVESNTVWEFDQPISSTPSLYCAVNLPTAFYTKESFCTTLSKTCSGGADPGDKKCQGGDVYMCNTGGAWEIKESCNFGCSNNRCEEQTCESHATKQCVGTSIYWFNSCGEKEEEFLRCNANEQCQNNACIPISPPPGCQKNEQCGTYQLCNTATAQCENINCPNGTIIEHACIPNPPDEGINTKTITGLTIGGIILLGSFFTYKQSTKRRKK